MRLIRPFLKSVFNYIYSFPLSGLIFLCILVTIAWGIGGAKLRDNKEWRIINVAMLLFSMFWVVAFTILIRGERTRRYSLILFESYGHISNDEFWRQIIMNLLLFWPVGLFFPFSLAKGKRVVMTFGSSLGLSLLLESLQFFLHRGKLEVDDVVMNVAGALFGCFAYALNVVLNSLQKRVYQNHTDEVKK